MKPKLDKEILAEATAIKEDEVDDLKQFIQKRQTQNAALKKLITKLNSDENQTINK